MDKTWDKFIALYPLLGFCIRSEQEIANGAEAVDAEIVFAELEQNVLDKYLALAITILIDQNNGPRIIHSVTAK